MINFEPNYPILIKSSFIGVLKRIILRLTINFFRLAAERC